MSCWTQHLQLGYSLAGVVMTQSPEEKWALPRSSLGQASPTLIVYCAAEKLKPKTHFFNTQEEEEIKNI